MTVESRSPSPGRWHRPLRLASMLASGFTALCCLGVTAALSLASAVGATVFTRDSSLRPLLAGALALTIAGSALSYRHHRHLGPLVATVAAAAGVYAFTFLVGGPHTEHTGGGHGDTSGRVSDGGRPGLVWAALAVLVAAQLWDLARERRRSAAG